jgi:two-component system, chemotaxis family, chemotaxis protein CheY
MRALVVDDSRTMRRILRGQMETLGYSAEEAENGKEALDVLEQIGPVELVLIDWNMPVMNGLELVQALRANPVYEASRLMLVTSETDMDRVVAALEAGANEYLMKPITPELLSDKLRILGLPCS